MDENIQDFKIKPGQTLSGQVVYPIHLMPQWLQIAATEHAESYGTPIELWATSFLSGIAIAAGKRAHLITNNYKNYPQLWIMIVGKSGSGKSEPFKAAFKHFTSLNKKAYDLYTEQRQEWEMNDKQGAAPRFDQILIGDTTPEALFDTLSYATDGLTLYRDELSGWFEDMGRYSKSGEIGHYLSISDNFDIPINRKNGNLLISDPYLNIFGTIQPSVLVNKLSSNNADDRGFSQRFLYLYPDYPIRKYNPTPVSKNCLNRYHATIEKIQRLNEIEFNMDQAAHKLYENYFNETENQRAASDEFWAATFSKAQIQVLRLALVVRLARYGDDNGKNNRTVEAADMQTAIELMHYFIQSIEKFKAEVGDPRPSKKNFVKQILGINPEASQTAIASVLGVTQPYISKVIKEMKGGADEQ